MPIRVKSNCTIYCLLKTPVILLARNFEDNQSNMNNHLIQNKSITVKNINYWPKSEDEGRRPRMANPRFTTSTNDYNKETKEKFKNEFSNWQSKKPRNIDTNWFTTAKGNMGYQVSKKVNKY